MENSTRNSESNPQPIDSALNNVVAAQYKVGSAPRSNGSAPRSNGLAPRSVGSTPRSVGSAPGSVGSAPMNIRPSTGDPATRYFEGKISRQATSEKA